MGAVLSVKLNGTKECQKAFLHFAPLGWWKRPQWRWTTYVCRCGIFPQKSYVEKPKGKTWFGDGNSLRGLQQPVVFMSKDLKYFRDGEDQNYYTLLQQIKYGYIPIRVSSKINIE